MGVPQVVERGLRLTLGSLLVLAALTLLGTSAVAQTQMAGSSLQTPLAATQAPGQGLALSYGYYSRYQRFGLTYATAPLWSHAFTNNGRLDLNVDFGVGYWKADNRHPDSMWDMAIVPTLRWWPGSTYYFEAGLGPTLISRTDFAGKELSTRFQFTTHVGGGFVVNGAHRFGLRWTHVSNAGIKRPNPGLDLVEAHYTYHF
ncbi:MAG TPA: acyloxyacyl hydrolase [Pusillimonas sp.]|uniref:acyloxyacyl hydrolase n=1 Tax=Pusillimonas sp. TaxID=3040095 RepID=UPI002B5C10A6|nr:acyloxyacyl hydrolase [Pusillimonas sp.]HUH86441.1 acyloxyacyl hydrolase [Pusillimonas sp.]